MKRYCLSIDVPDEDSIASVIGKMRSAADVLTLQTSDLAVDEQRELDMSSWHPLKRNGLFYRTE